MRLPWPQRARIRQVDSPAPPCRFAPAGQRIRAVHTHLPRRRPFPRASGALAFKSYIVHPTSYMSSCLAAAWGRRACCTSYIGASSASCSALPRATRANFPNRTSYIVNRTWAGPLCHRPRTVSPHSARICSAFPQLRCALSPNRTSYLVHRT